MLRIHFTPADLVRVRIAAEPDPLWETVLSLFRLRRRGPTLAFGRWRRHALRAINRADLEILMPLVRPAYYPDFLTPAAAASGLPAGIEALRSTPVAQLRRDTERLVAAGGPVPSWLGLLAEGDQATVDRVAAAVRSHFDAVVAPFWADARALIEAERSRRARVLLDEGTEGLLRSFRPMMTWEAPTARTHPIEGSVAARRQERDAALRTHLPPHGDSATSTSRVNAQAAMDARGVLPQDRRLFLTKEACLFGSL
ncbi:hypothetical protein ACQPZX_34440 [Actinoplanes sp. CA-142083]|uniref:hypothetical protein n=1 Tax=Actinoplanes sp. CA-142083 TaxID=3239903 RepID=UPI003D923796